MTDHFGRIISDDQVEDSVIDSLWRWFPTYLSEIERQRGLDVPFYDRPAPSSYMPRTTFDKWPEDMVPCIIVVSPGIEDDPVREGRGRYRARWEIGTIAVVESIDRDSTRKMAYHFGAAIRGVLIQHQTLDQALDATVRGIDWIGERNNELPEQDQRTIWANRQLFTVEVGDVLARNVGPPNPEIGPTTDPPWPPIPVADPVTVTTTITKEPIPR